MTGVREGVLGHMGEVEETQVGWVVRVCAYMFVCVCVCVCIFVSESVYCSVVCVSMLGPRHTNLHPTPYNYTHMHTRTHTHINLPRSHGCNEREN